MNDITALALLVSKAKASAFTMEYISQFEASDIDSDDVDLRFEVDGVETGTNVSIVDECSQAAQVITALVEALEKARKTNITQREYYEFVISDGSRRITGLVEALEKTQHHAQEWKSLCEAAAIDLDAWSEIDERSRGLICKMADSIIALNKHIALLESRTVTVKLPEGYAIRPGHPINEGERGVMIPKDGGTWLSRFDVEHTLQVAGIQVIEGEE